MTAAQLAKATGGTAAILGATLGDAMGRVVSGLEAGAATLRVSSSDAQVGFITPPSHENDPMRECLVGTPSAATMVALACVESSLVGPDLDQPEALVEDALRRVCTLGFPFNRKTVSGSLLAPSPAVWETVKSYGSSVTSLSCPSAQPDASILISAVALGAMGTPMDRMALILRGVSRDPITLCACLALGDLVRRAAAGETTADAVVADARSAEERALGLLRMLPGTLAGPPEMGHGALAMSLARARSSFSGDDALLPLTRDTQSSPEVVLASVLGCVMVEPTQVLRHVAVMMRSGGAAYAAAGTLLGLVGALNGLKGIPLAWLGTLREEDALTGFAEGACGKKKAARLAFPAADLAWRWQRAESAFRNQREAERRAQPSPARTEQLALFGFSNKTPER